ncbi:uroporphyrinogen-III C-methyltransferase [Vibrio aquimaris]|uniref:Uroporphyrinogen-III C-methyltransferase n=1 Tax=Vibrio aquimaris TaxID=2587862 RepID=A0A5P9CMR3_9VIBR|nr:uroporphyrinogen-III C-methyltransferase [Vibrio aquimaris]QFT27506.1 Putative uroporphyrinogen-III C-methyltransferase [Vibrio aquimaris]
MTSKDKNNSIEPETDITAQEIAKDKAKAPNKDIKKEHIHNKAAPNSMRLGWLAIALSIVLPSGVAYYSYEQNAQYEIQISSLQAQLMQAKTTIQQELNANQEATVSKVENAAQNAETRLAQQQRSINSLQLALADVKGRHPNDWLLAEADYLVKLAGRKLFLEHDAASATELMESADQRIATLNDPSLVPLRQSMSNDIMTLKSIPIIDKDGLVLRLTSLQQQVDNLPLANAILPDTQKNEQPSVSTDIHDWKSNLLTSLKDFSQNFITFRTRDGSAIPLLSPQQHFYLRENIKAKLETAIKAVYIGQQNIYSTALTTADNWSSTYFNQESSMVNEFNSALALLSKQNIHVDYPVKLETQQVLSDVIQDRLRRDVATLITEDK